MTQLLAPPFTRFLVCSIPLNSLSTWILSALLKTFTMSCNCHRSQNIPAYSLPVGRSDQPAKSQGRGSLMNLESNKRGLTGNLTFNTHSASWAMGWSCSWDWNFPLPHWRKHKIVLGSLWQKSGPTPLIFPWYNLDHAPEQDGFHGKGRMAHWSLIR